MSTALYRRYRPQDFADVIGQEHVTEPLMQALRSGRIGHAYLFSGPRGCGKTTSARILARCLNCEQGPTPTPCGECDSCRALATGGSGSVDVIEIDAASHGGVDDARDLREKAAYGPAQSRYKVYIIDEAHMVTPQGFNALLKIVEEPPEHVKFVFATTEPEKVIGTIRSRTHHYPFRLVPPARLQDYLEELCTRENVQVEPGVLSFVVRAGGGSVRDSLSVLDQLIAGSDDAGLTYAGAAALLGFTESELLDACVDALAAGDGAGVFRQVDRVIETGQDPRRFVEDLLERFRDLIVLAAISASPDAETATAAVLRGIPEDQIVRMRQQAGAFGPGQLSYAADIVNAGLTEMTGATSPRLQLELLCARLLLPSGAGEKGHAARLDRLERRLDVGGGVAAPIPPSSGPGAPGPSAAAPVPPQSVADLPAPSDEPERPHLEGPSRPEQVAESRARPQAPDRAAPAPSRPTPRGAQTPAPDQQRPRGDGRPEQTTPQQTAPQQATPAAPRGGVDTEMIRRNWPDVLQRIYNIRRVTWTFLSEHAQVLDYDGSRLLLGLSTKGLATTFRNGPHGEVVRQALSEALGIDARVEGIPASDAPRGSHGRGAAGGLPVDGPAPAGPADRGRGPGGPPSQGAPQRARDDSAAEGTPAGEPNGDARSSAGRGRRVGSDAGPGMGVAYDDDRPPPSDDDIPPDEESLPPDPGMRGAGSRRPPAAATGSPGGEGSPTPGGPVSAAREGAPTPGGDAPSGATDPGGASEPAGSSDPAEPAAARRAHAGAAQAREALRAARTPGHAPQAGAPAGPARQVDHDAEASVDDEDIADAGAVGQPVIASVLGGVVIREDEG